MIKYKVETLSNENIVEAMPIFEAHRVELQSYSDMKLNPDWEAYMRMEAWEKLVWLVAREDGIIVGYAVFVLGNNLHYKDYLFAVEDIFYVVNDKRGTRIAYNLIKKSEKILKEMGVHVITHHAKFTNRFAPFIERLGYNKTEIMLSKRINNER